MRIVPKPATKGSQYWLQRFVAERPDLLQCPAIGSVRWVSPLAYDDFAEYRDGAFLEKLKLGHLAGDLAAFWPSRGPQWDGLGLTASGVMLVEAKSHIRELFSPPSAASVVSLARIEASLDGVRAALGAPAGVSWSQTFYQLANRIAHLNFLHARGVEAHLLLIGFINDKAMGGPSDAEQWIAAYGAAEAALGLPESHPLSSRVHHVYPDVRALAASTTEC
jgi:hypothetical protein